MLLRFDEEKLCAAVGRLHLPCAMAFGAACAERQIPSYARYAKRSGQGDPTAPREALSCLWRDIQGESVPPGALQRHQAVCRALAQEEGQGPDWPYAEDAVSAVYYLIDAWLKGAAVGGASGAGMAYDSLDTYVQKLHPGLSDPHIAADPLIQVEFLRQARDLAELAAAPPDRAQMLSAIAAVRSRAEVDAAIFFDTEAARKQLK